MRYSLHILIISVAFSRILVAQDDFRVYPYLQNPGPHAITILWFSGEQSPGVVYYWKKGTQGKDTAASNPVPAESLSYSSWEDTTFFEGEAPPIPYRHRVRIKDLDPAAFYEYSVTQGTTFFSSTFRTAPDGDSAIRFIVYADSETEPESTGKFTNWVDPMNDSVRAYLWDQTTGYRKNLEVIRSREPDLVFIAGDLVESGGEQRDWDEFWRHNTHREGELSLAGQVPLMAAPGNHEYYEGPVLDRYDQPGSERAVKRFLTYFESPPNDSPVPEQEGRYYCLDYGPATFIVLDACNNSPNGSAYDTNFYLLGENDAGGGHAPDFGPGSVQYNWLEQKLIRSREESLFTFVILHHAPYSSGPHGFPAGTDESFDKQSGVPVRELTPLFMKYGVDAVFSGHDEMWERSEVSGMEVKPDSSEVPHTIHFYDVGTGGDGLRGPVEGTDNTYQQFLVHTDVPETWQEGILLEGGKHYGHLEVDIFPEYPHTWKAILKPVYVFPRYNEEDSAYSGIERRIYDDEIILESSYEEAVSVKVQPAHLLLSRQHPNPFQLNTVFEYELIGRCDVKIRILDLRGTVLRLLEEGFKEPGIHTAAWDGRDKAGKRVPPGIYFYRIETGLGDVQSGRMVLIY